MSILCTGTPGSSFGHVVFDETSLLMNPDLR